MSDVTGEHLCGFYMGAAMASTASAYLLTGAARDYLDIAANPDAASQEIGRRRAVLRHYAERYLQSEGALDEAIKHAKQVDIVEPTESGE